ncbi:MAG: hypothetical protein ABR866_08050 [Candidatus Korobacteraceae bacterium]|jgi:hypothetical protein
MLQGENYPYEIIKINHSTGKSESIGVIKGESAASSFADSSRSKLSQAERDAGWGYYIERTTRKPTILPRRSVNLKPDAFRKR